MGMLLKLREAILGAAFALIVMTTAAVPFTNAQETTDQVRIRGLEMVTGPMQVKLGDHEGRIIRLEDAVTEIRNDAEESRWWARGIGIALALAVVERVLRTAGVIGKSDGMGPVG